MNARPFAFLYVVLVCLAGCRPAEKTAVVGEPMEWFVDRTEETGLTFTHFNGMTGDFYYPEVMPPGVALLDFDNDGDLDVFVIQGEMFSGKVIDAALYPPKSPLSSRLFRNEVGPVGPASPKGPALRFTDVTEQARIDVRGYGMGAAAGDYNNDGCVDLYVTKLGSNRLLKNNCDGTFTDATAVSRRGRSGMERVRSLRGHRSRRLARSLRRSVSRITDCRERSATASPVSATTAAARVSGAAEPSVPQQSRRHVQRHHCCGGHGHRVRSRAGCLRRDFNRDGWIDLYVANDGAPNQLWINQRNGTFKNTALLAGAAVSAEGRLKASMGVDAGDFDEDGDDDMFVGELTGQGADLYVNDGSGVFVEGSAQAGIRLRTLPFTAFGAAWLDADNDGRLDLAIVNGAVTHTAEALAANERFRLQQRSQLFRNVGKGRFEEATDRAGRAFSTEEVGRGAAFGDVDNDGDTDIVIANDNGPVRVLVNNVGSRANWMGLRLVTGEARPEGRALRVRDALGARVAIVSDSGAIRWRRARADGSYASANDPRVLVGLGDAAPQSVKAQVFWPSGRAEEWSVVAAGRYSTLTEGTGTASRTSDTPPPRP